jgi:hypothetical protein
MSNARSVPHLQLPREDQHSPSERHEYEQHHAGLNQPSRIHALRERTDGNRKEQETAASAQ